ncbi:glycoside hydrolase N-terminal domain-containing protein [Sphaerisporangium sp. TRM90804]|nr:glycoside hydrolase N-terminal domain-containing protein [Sphaerisporangium sp. TRM90804]
MLTLWYDRPAAGPDEHDAWQRPALPIGNGRLGAMVFGGVRDERLVLNESTLWTGGPGSRHAGPGSYQPLADLSLTVETPGAVCGYRRELDPRTAVASVRYTAGGVVFVREHFASHPAQVVVVRLTAGRPGGVTLVVRLTGTAPCHTGGVRVAGAGLLTLRGALEDNGLRFECQVRVLNEGGDRADAEGAVTVTAADAVTLVVGAGTDYAAAHPAYRGHDPHEPVTARMDAAGARGYAALRAEHVADHRRLFDRVRLDLGQGAPLHAAGPAGREPALPGAHAAAFPDGPETARSGGPATAPAGGQGRAPAGGREPAPAGGPRTAPADQPAVAPLDRALAAYGGGGPGDRALEALLFSYGRYLLIASAREGSPAPAGLRGGLWRDGAGPPWTAAGHPALTMPMSHWPAEVTGLGECAEPLSRHLGALRPPGRAAAEASGGTGWLTHAVTDPFGFTGPAEGTGGTRAITGPFGLTGPGAGTSGTRTVTGPFGPTGPGAGTGPRFPEGGAWLAQHAYERFLFGGDAAYLRDHAYPLLREAAEFWLDRLAGDGGLLGPSSDGAASAQQIVWDLVANTVEAAEFLGLDPGYRLLRALGELDEGLRVGAAGQLQEWRDDREDPWAADPGVLHLFALHPGRRIRPCTPLGEAARVTLERRGDGGPCWSRAWKISLWARLLDGDRAHRLLAGQIADAARPGPRDDPPFQAAGVLGTTAGIAEMLVQSHAGVVDVLPAPPSAWPHGSFDGLRARGGHTVGATWVNGEVAEVRLTAGHDGEVRVRNVAFLGGCGASVPCAVEADTAVVPARAGHTYRLTPVR